MATTKTKDDKRITDLQVRNLKGKISEPADKDQKRGFGTLLFERRPSGIVEAYYRQRVDGKDVTLKLGTYKSNPRAAGMTVSQIRDKANEYAAIAAKHGNVKAYIEEQEAAAAAERAERQRQRVLARRAHPALVDAGQALEVDARPVRSCLNSAWSTSSAPCMRRSRSF